MGILRWLRGEGGDGPGLVVLRDSVDWNEAVLIRGLLDGAGIDVSMVTLDPATPHQTMAPPRLVRLLVYADRLAEAEELLAAPPSRVVAGARSLAAMDRPGDDLARVDVLPNLPSGYVRVRDALPYEEGIVVHGLLVSSDIPAALVMMPNGAAAYTRQVPMHLSVAVPEDRAEEADALLREDVVGDAGDVGAE